MLWDENGRNYGWDTQIRKHRSLRAHALLANTEGVKMGERGSEIEYCLKGRKCPRG